MKPVTLNADKVIKNAIKAFKSDKLQCFKKNRRSNKCKYRSGKNNETVCIIGASLTKTQGIRFDEEYLYKYNTISTLIETGRVKTNNKFLLGRLQRLHDGYINNIIQPRNKNIDKLKKEFVENFNLIMSEFKRKERLEIK